MPDVYFTGTIKNLKSGSNPNDASGMSSISEFLLTLSDGREYDVNILISENSGYIAVLVTRYGAQFLYIDGGDSKIDPMISQWAKSVMGDRYNDLEVVFIH